jgi:hypothetical protein
MATLRLVSRMNHVIITLLVGSSIAGLLYGPRGWWYGADPATLPAFIGQDVVTLLFAVPLLLVSSMMARHGSVRGMLCWMGALFYIAYSYYFHVIGGRFNAFFPLYIALVSMGTYGALAILFALDLERLPAAFARAPVRLVSAYLIVTALGFAGLWLAILDRHYVMGTALDPVARTVIAIDGVVLLPLLFYAGRALRRREPIGFALAGLLLVKAAATFLTLLVNLAVARWWGQPGDPVQTAAYAAGFAGAAALVVWYFRSMDAAAA